MSIAPPTVPGGRPPATPVLGVVADDLTGATDVASMLVRSGMRCVQVVGVPHDAAVSTLGAEGVDAIVVALKSRTQPAARAVADALAALDWLRRAGATQFYFKVCSTFDSTPGGNIGPVADALLDALHGAPGGGFTVACPAFPENGRTVFRGHLFVGDQLLSDSSMRHHPLTPMTDANLVRVLQAQTPHAVGLVRHDTVAQGADAVRARFDALRAQGVRHAVVDAIDDRDLRTIARACATLPLIVAGAGLALGLPEALRERGVLGPGAGDEAARLAAVGGAQAILSGSCSAATRAQVAEWIAQGRPALSVDPRRLARGEPVADEVLCWARQRLAQGAVLVHAGAPAEELQAVQAELGAELAGDLVERCLAQVAHGLADAGVRRFVVAGGETSGAVVQALGVTQLRIGAAIDPGVPWTQAVGRPLLLALKSGNFGGRDFFGKALALSS